MVVVRILLGGPWEAVPELLFEKEGLIPAIQQLLVTHNPMSLPIYKNS